MIAQYHIPILHVCRKDWIFGIICLFIILIGVPIIGVKKWVHQKLLHKIPRSNIVNPVTTISKELNRTCKTSESPVFNTSKYNKNLINFIGVLVLASYFSVLAFSIVSTRLFCDESIYCLRNHELYSFVMWVCFPPLVFPIIYFLFWPKCFINAIRCLKDM